MPRYKFRLTRALTESTDVIIEANSLDEAHEKALEDPYGHEGWETDDCSTDKPYLPDASEAELLDDLPLRRWHLDIGNSSAGQIGMCAVVKATSKEEAHVILHESLPEEFAVEFLEPDSGIEYARVYLNLSHCADNITLWEDIEADLVEPEEPVEFRGHWDADPTHPLADWKAEIVNDETRQSYAEWCRQKTRDAEVNND